MKKVENHQSLKLSQTPEVETVTEWLGSFSFS